MSSIITKIAVIIPFHNNETGLAALLVNLQSQIILPSKIIIIDTSKNKAGFEVAKRYYTNLIPIAIESAPGCQIYEAWNKGIDLAGEDDCFIINDDVLLPMNTIDQLHYASTIFNAYCFVPDSPAKEHYKKGVDEVFRWYNDPAQDIEDFSMPKWMPGFAFMLTRKCIKEVGMFDLNYKIWFGDDAYQKDIFAKAKEKVAEEVLPIVKLNKLRIYHYGGSTYAYKSKKIRNIIDKDRVLFYEQFPEEKK